MHFVRNAWYVAGWAKEFDHELRHVKIFGEDLAALMRSPGQPKTAGARAFVCLPCISSHPCRSVKPSIGGCTYATRMWAMK